MDRYAVLSSPFFSCYAALWRIVRPFLRRARRLADGWEERLVPDDWTGPADLWIQAASGGEARLAVTLLRALGERLQKAGGEDRAGHAVRVLVTTWTRQGRDVLENSLVSPGRLAPALELAVRFAPLDDPAVARRAVARVCPRALLLLETELWPGLMGACAEAGVPVHIFNARMTRASYEGYRIIRSVLRALPVCRVHATSREDAERFFRLFGPDEGGRTFGRRRPCVVDVMPNIKLDRAAEALESPVRADLAGLFREAAPLILLASVRREEERLLAPLTGKLLRKFPRAVLVVAPRHMHRVRPWMERLHDLGHRPETVSSLPPGQVARPGRALVWDRFGDLPRLYAVADAVFVGGSLGRGGGQNFLEALAAGVVPCVGPSLDNFRWALGEDDPPSLADAGLLRVCSGPKAVGRYLEEVCRHVPDRWDGPPAREEVRRRFRQWLTPRTGGSRLAACLAAEALGLSDHAEIAPGPKGGVSAGNVAEAARSDF